MRSCPTSTCIGLAHKGRHELMRIVVRFRDHPIAEEFRESIIGTTDFYIYLELCWVVCNSPGQIPNQNWGRTNRMWTSHLSWDRTVETRPVQLACVFVVVDSSSDIIDVFVSEREAQQKKFVDGVIVGLDDFLRTTDRRS